MQPYWKITWIAMHALDLTSNFRSTNLKTSILQILFPIEHCVLCMICDPHYCHIKLIHTMRIKGHTQYANIQMEAKFAVAIYRICLISSRSYLIAAF